MKEWERYEQEIYDKYKNRFTNCEIIKNTKIVGKCSKVERQVDVLLKGIVGDRPVDVILECKYFNKKVNVKTIDSFIGFLEDVGVKYGTLITNKGFSEGAKNRAENSCNSNIKLDVVDFRKFDDYNFEPDITTCEVCDNEYQNAVCWDGNYPVEDFELAYCEYCNEPHMKCSYCGEITPLYFDADENGITECRGGCGLKVEFSADEEFGIDIKIISKGE